SAVAVLIAADMVSRGRMLQPRLPVVEHRALQDAHVLVASPRTADEDSRPGMRLCVAACAEDGMGSFYRRQNAFEPGAFAERIERLVISRRFVGDSPALHEKRVLWSDTRIVEAGGHRMRLAHLPERILQNQRIAPLQHAGSAECEGGCIIAEAGPAAA